MFPIVGVEISGLDEREHYIVALEIVPLDSKRYKYKDGWKSSGNAEPHVPKIYLHPDSPARGSHWMAQQISFNKAKLTNNTLDNSTNLVLNSMHKYRVQVHVIVGRDTNSMYGPLAKFNTYEFEEMDFIAVTAYQNPKVTELKVELNPFARGFRDNPSRRSTTDSSNNSRNSCTPTGKHNFFVYH